MNHAHTTPIDLAVAREAKRIARERIGVPNLSHDDAWGLCNFNGRNACLGAARAKLAQPPAPEDVMTDTPAPTDPPLTVDALASAAAAGWLPIVFCPTDGVWRMTRMSDGSEIAASFDGGWLDARRWRTRSFAYHNPSRPTGEVCGGVEQMSLPYDTHVIGDLPDGVHPVFFRPNDTTHGASAPATTPKDPT